LHDRKVVYIFKTLLKTHTALVSFVFIKKGYGCNTHEIYYSTLHLETRSSKGPAILGSLDLLRYLRPSAVWLYPVT
jgi:hypothetical protein